MVIRRSRVGHICDLRSAIGVHVAQWLERLAGYQKVEGSILSRDSETFSDYMHGLDKLAVLVC